MVLSNKNSVHIKINCYSFYVWKQRITEVLKNIILTEEII